jgi:hypothetical protein
MRKPAFEPCASRRAEPKFSGGPDWIHKIKHDGYRLFVQREGKRGRAAMQTASRKPRPDHFMKRPGCGQWFDMRDLGQVLAHVHDAEIEIGEGPPPTLQ